MEIYHPTAGEKVVKGVQYTIQWEDDGFGPWNVYLYKGAVLVDTLTTGTIYNYHIWNPSTGLTSCNDYRINILSTVSGYDYNSGYFTICSKTVRNITDSLNYGDSTSKNEALVKMLSESFNLQDLVQAIRHLIFEKSVNDSIGYGDLVQAIRHLIFEKNINDSIGYGDLVQAIRHLIFEKNISDSISYGDSIQVFIESPKEYSEQFQQNIDFRVLLFKRQAGTTCGKSIIRYYNKIYITLDEYQWLYSFYAYDSGDSTNIGPYVIYWSDNPEGVGVDDIKDENWYPLIAHDAKGFPHTLNFDYILDDNGSPTLTDKTHILPPIYARYLKMQISRMWSVEQVTIYNEDYFDLTGYIMDEITRTRRMDQTIRHYQRPTAQIILDNSEGLFNRRNEDSPFYGYLKSGVRFTIDIKFMGEKWEDPGIYWWIPMGSFRAKSYSKDDNAKKVTIYGEAGRQLTLQNTTQRIFEQVTIRKFVEYLLKDDQQQKPICALIPRKNQVRTMVGEELGVGKFNDPEYEKNLLNIAGDGFFLCACASNDKGDYYARGMADLEVDSSYIVINDPMRIYVNGGANYIDVVVPSYYYGGSGPVDFLCSIAVDEDYIYMIDIPVSRHTLIDYEDISIRKIDIKTGRVLTEIDSANIFNLSGVPPYYYVHGIGLVFKKDDSKLYGYYKLSNLASSAFYIIEIDKDTLYATGSPVQKTNSNIAYSSISGCVYDDLYKEWNLLFTRYHPTSYAVLSNRYIVYNENFSICLEDLCIMLNTDTDNLERFGLTIRSNRDFICGVYDGPDNWIFTFAKRQFWLYGNIQDTSGPLEDTVFFDHPQIYRDHLLESSGSWLNYVVETVDYWLNVKTGELILKRPLLQDSRLWANYDYHPSINFPEIEDMKRFEAIQQAAEVENWRLQIDERENVNLQERIHEEIIPTMDYSEDYNTICTFETDPISGLPDYIYIDTIGYPLYTIRDTNGGNMFQNVQAHDEVIITDDHLIPAKYEGNFLIKEKFDNNRIYTYHEFGSSEFCAIDGYVRRCTITRTPKSVLLGQTYAGKDIGLLNIIHNGDHKTIRVFSQDFLEQLVEDTDFTITTDGSGYKTINFIDTDRVRNNPAVIVQYFTQEKLYDLIDTHNIITEIEGWNEETIKNKITVEGQRLLPDVTRLSLVKQYAIAPYSKQKRSDLPLIQEVSSTGQYTWKSDDERTDYAEKDVTKQNFLLEFEYPLIIGTTAFMVIYGDQGKIRAKGTIYHTKRDAVYYWEVIGSLDDANYLVILSNRREFRVCTAADYKDMVDPDTGDWLVDGNNDEIGSGNPPDSAADIKTNVHFYIKQMNGAYGRDDTLYAAYYERSVNYYIDEYGRVIEGSIEPNEEGQGVFTGYPNKAATVIIKPKDSQGATLFDMHGVLGEPGYNGGGFYADVEDVTFALRINRVQVDSKGVNLLFDNWGEIEQNIEVNISGYPLSRVEKIDVEAGPTNTEIEEYGERDEKIENLFIGEKYQAQSLAYSIRQLFKDEKSKFNVSIVLAPQLKLDDIIQLTNANEYLNQDLMRITEIVDHIRKNAASSTDLIVIKFA